MTGSASEAPALDGVEVGAEAASWGSLDLGWFTAAAVAIVAIVAYKTGMIVAEPLTGVLDGNGNAVGRDFAVFWSGARFAINGRMDLFADPIQYHQALKVLFGGTMEFHYFPYAPNALLLFVPLGWVSYWVGLAIWTAGSITLLVWALRRAGANRVPLGTLVLAPAVVVNAFLGQNGSLSAGLLVGGLAHVRSRPILSGVLLGLATYKPHLGLAIPFALVALRAWRTISVAVTTALGLVLGSVIAFGTTPWVVWLDVAAPLQRAYLEIFRAGNLSMMFSVAGSSRLLGLDGTVIYLPQMVVSSVVFIALIRVLPRLSDHRSVAAVTLAAAPLVTPYLHFYDLVLLVGALAFMTPGLLPSGSIGTSLVRQAWILPGAGWLLHLLSVPIAPLVLGAFFLVVLRSAIANSREAVPVG